MMRPLPHPPPSTCDDYEYFMRTYAQGQTFATYLSESENNVHGKVRHRPPPGPLPHPHASPWAAPSPSPTHPPLPLGRSLTHTPPLGRSLTQVHFAIGGAGGDNAKLVDDKLRKKYGFKQ